MAAKILTTRELKICREEIMAAWVVRRYGKRRYEIIDSHLMALKRIEELESELKYRDALNSMPND